MEASYLATIVCLLTNIRYSFADRYQNCVRVAGDGTMEHFSGMYERRQMSYRTYPVYEMTENQLSSHSCGCKCLDSDYHDYHDLNLNDK